MGAEAPRIKGSAIREVAKWYLRRHGRPGIDAVLDALPPEVRADLVVDDEARGLRANRWYDVRLVHAMLDGLVGPYPPAERARMMHEATRASIDKSMRGIYGFLLGKIVTPELYARNIQRLWRVLHDTGEREITITAPGQATSRTWDWLGHHPLLCELNQQTMSAIFEKMGETDVRVTRVTCVGDDRSGECVYTVTWRPR